MLLAGLCLGVSLLLSLFLMAGNAEGKEAAESSPSNPLAQPEQPQTGLSETEMRVSGKKYRLEVASTEAQAEIGLMYRTVLPEGRGMLFRFDSVRPVAFWMKNTKIPLDMLFVRDNKVLHIAHSAKPCLSDPCPIYPSKQPVDMVIELPGGTAIRDRILDGSTIQWLSGAVGTQQTVKSRTTKK